MAHKDLIYRAGSFLMYGGPALFLLIFVVPRHWKHDETSGMHYLDSLGIGAAVWSCLLGAICISTTAAPGVANDFAFQDLPASFQPVKLSDGKGLDDADIAAAFGESAGLLKWGKFLWLLARCALNAASSAVLFYTLPTRDPDERLNEAKHIVAWVEFPLLMLYSALSVVNLLPLFSGCHNWVETTWKWSNYTASFSSLKFLPKVNPMNVASEVAKKRAFYMKGVVLFSHPIMAGVAVLSLMVKVSTVDFVSDKIYWDWSWTEVFTFAGFINNLAGVVPQESLLQIEGALLFINPFDRTCIDKFNRDLGSRLSEKYGFEAIVIFNARDLTCYTKLLNENARLQDETVYESLSQRLL